ncbi:Vegetative incompatibility protein [Apiospora saccharicola]|uniref:Vegetative incompatibility protein n=1 Tax=Apiospora saccharicola TaxID=335842 RepID=A0ABR1UJR7_9PEZI
MFGREFNFSGKLTQTINLIQTFKGLVDEAVKVSPEASLAWAGVSLLLPLLTKPEEAKVANMEGLTYCTCRIRYYATLENLLLPEDLCNPGLKSAFEDRIVDLYQHILEFQLKTALRFHQKGLVRWARDLGSLDEWKAMLTKVKAKEEEVRKESNSLYSIASHSTLQNISTEAEEHHSQMESSVQSLLSVAEDMRAALNEMKQALDSYVTKLPVVDEACYSSDDVQRSPKCMDGTRIGILKEIEGWASNQSGESFFWLDGLAGTGKSTIARTVADIFSNEGRLAAGYFFKRGEQGRNDSSRLFTTLAKQLAEAFPSLRGCLQASLRDCEKASLEKMSLESQFKKLFSNVDLPLHDTSQQSRVVIIDALDECERLGDFKMVFGLLLKLCNITRVRLRVFVTSRPDPNILIAFRHLLETNSARRLSLHKASSDDTKADIRIVLERRFAKLKDDGVFGQGPWPTVKVLDRLVQLATNPEPLFIYAATFCRFLYDEQKPRNPVTQLELWLENHESSRSQMQQIYDPILRQAFRGISDEVELRPMLEFLGALVLLATPLPASSLAVLLHTDNFTWWLRELHAVLDIPDASESNRPTRLLHKSFSDFLLGSDLSNTRLYRVDAAKIHTSLAKKCIQRMTTGLGEVIGDVRQLVVDRHDVQKQNLDQCLPQELQYACRFWDYHLKYSGQPFDNDIHNDIHNFFDNHLAHWLEVAYVGRKRSWDLIPDLEKK